MTESRVEILRRCHASVMRAADLVEQHEPILATETLHYVASDLEDLIEQEKRIEFLLIAANFDGDDDGPDE